MTVINGNAGIGTKRVYIKVLFYKSQKSTQEDLMKKGFVLLLALVVSLAVFAAGTGYEGDYNSYDGDYTGYYYGDQNGSSNNDSVSRNAVVFNYLFCSSNSYADYTMEVTLKISTPPGTMRVVLHARYDFISYDITDWWEFKTFHALGSKPSYSYRHNNSIQITVEDVSEYGDAAEYRAAFYNFRGKLLGISNIARAVWTPII